VNNRCDFLLLAFDPIVNIIDKWKYMYDGNSGTCPIVIMAVIGRGWGQGATHSQTFHNFFSRLNGFDVFLPTFPSDIKNVINYALKSNKPSIILQHRGLFELKEASYKRKKYFYGKSNIVRKGKDLAIITLSYGTIQSLQIYERLKNQFNKKITIVDLISVKPLDIKLILNVAKKHKSIIILDIDSTFSGIASEISCIIFEKFKNIKIKRFGNALTPAPAANNLESLFYPSNQIIFDECCKLLKIKNNKNYINNDYKFLGPY
jgi:pyruvate dehydrogenase E1 component beta subunit